MIPHTSLRPFLGAAALALAVLASACVEKGGAPTKESFTGPAKLMIVGGDSVNWGRTAPGLLKHAIKLVNVGGDTLRIKDVHPGCGCTTAPLDKKDLGPGDTATVDVTLDAKSRSGLLHKSLTLTTNDSARPSIVMALIAEIERDITMTTDIFPPVMVSKVGEEGTTTLSMRNASDHPISLEAPMQSPSPLLIKFDMTGPRTLAPGDSMSITARVKVLKAEGGNAQITMATSSKLVPKLEMTITGQVDPRALSSGADQKLMPAPKDAATILGKPGKK